MSSKYGPGPYGEGKYSAEDYDTGFAGVWALNIGLSARLSATETLAGTWALQLGFAADLSFAVIDELAGTLALQVSFNANLSSSGVDLAGLLSIQPAFAATLANQAALAGAWALDVEWSGQMALQANLAGSWSLSIGIAVPADLLVYTGPLWEPVTPCPPAMWAEDDLCPLEPWIPEIDQGGFVYQPSLYGMLAYGVSHYSLGTYVPPATSPWDPDTLCPVAPWTPDASINSPWVPANG